LPIHWESRDGSTSHFHDILIDTHDILARMSGMSGDFPIQLATLLPGWSDSGLLLCVVLPICPFVVLQILSARHVRLVVDKSLASL